MSDHAFNKASQDLWDRMAAAWDNRRTYMWESSKPVGEWLVNNLDVRPGQTLLELAAGIGDSGFLAASMLGDQGRLISTDFAPSMVEGAKRRGEELGLQNVDFRILDAQQMDLQDDCVDGVLCRWGYMLMGEPDVALGETRRVLRGGGRLCLSVFSTPDENPWAALPARALIAGGFMEAPPPGSPGIFALGDRQRLEGLLRSAGFAEVSFGDIPTTWRYDSFDDYWFFVTNVAGAIATRIEALDEGERAKVREALREAVAGYGDGDGIALPGMTLNAAAS